MKTLYILMLSSCFLNASVVNTIRASDMHYSEIYYNGINSTIRCYGDLIEDGNVISCYARHNSSDESTSAVTNIGFAVFSAVLGAYLVQPSWDYFLKPQFIKIKDTVSPYAESMWENIYSRCCLGGVPLTKYSHANMDDIKKVFGFSVSMNYMSNLEDIDKLLLEQKWRKKPIVFSFKSENFLQDQQISKRLVGYRYTGFGSSLYQISLVSGWSDKDIERDNYHLNPLFNHISLYDVLERETEFYPNETINIIPPISKRKNMFPDDNETQPKKSKNKDKNKGKEVIDFNTKRDQDQLSSVTHSFKSDLVNDILKDINSKVASIISSFTINNNFMLCHRYNSLYIVFPKMDQTDLSNAYIQLEKIKFRGN